MKMLPYGGNSGQDAGYQLLLAVQHHLIQAEDHKNICKNPLLKMYIKSVFRIRALLSGSGSDFFNSLE